MRYFDAKVVENRSLGGGYYVLGLAGCASLESAKPGQFIMIRGNWQRDPLLPRAFSLLAVGGGGQAQILAKTVGRATALLESTAVGATVAVLGPLGTNFPEPTPEAIDLLVAGGVGLPPLYMQAADAAARRLAHRSEILYGGRGAADIVLRPELAGMGVDLHITTEDGALGLRGRVTLALEQRIAHHQGKLLRVMACGPNAMLWAVARIAKKHGVPCFISLEEQMACGIGVCLGCAIPARSRPFRYVCSNGPVFDASDVLDVPPSTGGGSTAPATCVA